MHFLLSTCAQLQCTAKTNLANILDKYRDINLGAEHSVVKRQWSAYASLSNVAEASSFGLHNTGIGNFNKIPWKISKFDSTGKNWHKRGHTILDS